MWNVNINSDKGKKLQLRPKQKWACPGNTTKETLVCLECRKWRGCGHKPVSVKAMRIWNILEWGLYTGLMWLDISLFFNGKWSTFCGCCCSFSQLCPTLCDPMSCGMPSFPVLGLLPQFAQTHVHWVRDAIHLYRSLSFPPPLAFNLSQHQGLF